MADPFLIIVGNDSDSDPVTIPLDEKVEIYELRGEQIFDASHKGLYRRVAVILPTADNHVRLEGGLSHDDPNSMHVIRLNQIIRNAQRAIQMGENMEQVWKALYVPKDLLHPVPPQIEEVRESG